MNGKTANDTGDREIMERQNGLMMDSDTSSMRSCLAIPLGTIFLVSSKDDTNDLPWHVTMYI